MSDNWLITDTEIMDFTVLGADGSVTERMQNEAARTELARRGLDPGPPSGEVAPDTIVWVEFNTGPVPPPLPPPPVSTPAA